MAKYKNKNMRSFHNMLNNRTFSDYTYRLTMLATNLFEWSGLPEGIDPEYIEKYLFHQGECMLFKDKNLGFIVTKCTESGNLNYYDEPTKLQPTATNYINVKRYTPGEDCVLIRNNDLRIPTLPTIELFAYRLASISRTIDINIHAQKTPIIVKGTKKQMLSLKTMYDQWDEMRPVIFGDEDMNLDALSVINTEAPIVFDKLQLQKHAIWNEAMTFLGINNANQDKKERLVDDEVQANNEQVMMSGEIMLRARERACKELKEVFGLNVSVKLRNTRNNVSEASEEGSDDLGGVAV